MLLLAVGLGFGCGCEEASDGGIIFGDAWVNSVCMMSFVCWSIVHFHLVMSGGFMYVVV